MRNLILILLISLFYNNTIYSQSMWVLMDGYEGVSIEEGFCIGLYKPNSFYLPTDKINPKEVNRFPPFVKVENDKNEYISVWFDFTKKMVTIYDNFEKTTIDVLKITKTKMNVGNRSDLGEFYVKAKKGKERYVFMFNDTKDEYNFFMVYKHKDFSFTKVFYDMLPDFYYKTDRH